MNTTVLSKTNRGSSNSKRHCAGRRPGDNPPAARLLQGRLVGPCDRKLANALRIDIRSSVFFLQGCAIRREELCSQQPQPFSGRLGRKKGLPVRFVVSFYQDLRSGGPAPTEFGIEVVDVLNRERFEPSLIQGPLPMYRRRATASRAYALGLRTNSVSSPWCRGQSTRCQWFAHSRHNSIAASHAPGALRLKPVRRRRNWLPSQTPPAAPRHGSARDTPSHQERCEGDAASHYATVDDIGRQEKSCVLSGTAA